MVEQNALGVVVVIHMIDVPVPIATRIRITVMCEATALSRALSVAADAFQVPAAEERRNGPQDPSRITRGDRPDNSSKFPTVVRNHEARRS